MGTRVLLLNAGHEATVSSTLLGWWSVFRNPDRLRELHADRSLLPNAIEELLRFVQIPRGAELGLLFGSANRDPSVFDRPDELHLTREPNPHLSFGAGIHFCLGGPLGHQELQVSFTTLMDRFPNLELVGGPAGSRTM